MKANLDITKQYSSSTFHYVSLLIFKKLK